MSKYRDRGAYHFELFAKKGDPYRLHVLDVIEKVHQFVPDDCANYLLDVGSGEGLIANRLQNDGYQVVCVEPDPWARELAAKRGIRIHHTSIDELNVTSFYGCVLILDVLEHVPDPLSVVQRLKELTAVLFIAVPDRNDPHGCREFDPDDVRELVLDEGWEEKHFETRHARHFFVFERNGAEVTVPVFEASEEL